MSQRYRAERAQNGDILDPSPWNLNQNELASEFNGYLDHDNLPLACIGEDQTVVGAFTVDAGDTGTSFTPDMTTVEWQNVLSVTITTAVDMPLMVDAGAGHQWDQASGGNSFDGVSADCIQYQITIDGHVVAESGWLGDDHKWDCVDLCGTRSVQAGEHTVVLRVNVANRYFTVGRNMAGDCGQLFSYRKGCMNGVTLSYHEVIVTGWAR